MTKNKGMTKKIVAGALVLAIATSGVCLLGYTSRDNDGNWFGGLHWADNGLNEGNGNGGPIISDGESNSMRLMSMMIPAEDYDEYGVSALAESASIVTATITPEATTNKNVTWTCSDTSGKVTVTAVEGNPLQAVVAVTGAFDTQVTITCTLEANTSIKASLTVDYVKGLTVGRITPKSFDSIKSALSVADAYTLTTGTISPTSYKGSVVLSMDITLYNYLKTKHSTVVQSKTVATSVDEINNPGQYYFKELFGTTSESEINSIYEDIAIYYYNSSSIKIGSMSYNSVSCYYNDVETSTYDKDAIKTGLNITSLADIYVNPTGVSLSDGGLIFGANGEV